MTLYANLDFAKRELETAQATSAVLTTNDQLLLGHLRQVSDRLDSEFPQVPRWTYFAPWYGSRKYLITPFSTHVNSRLNTFQFKDNLLTLSAVTLGTQALVPGANVEAWPDSAQPPFHALRLIGCCRTWYDYCAGCAAPLQVTVTGLWGYHRDYANAWAQITTLGAGMTPTQTTITVSAGGLSAPDPYGITPGISIGTLLQIDDGSGEFMEVTGVDVATNTATVLRGVNGTSTLTAAHTTGDGVLAYQVETPVQIAVARQADLMYARRGKYTTMEVQGMTEVRYPSDWLYEVRAMMQGYSMGY